MSMRANFNGSLYIENTGRPKPDFVPRFGGQQFKKTPVSLAKVNWERPEPKVPPAPGSKRKRSHHKKLP